MSRFEPSRFLHSILDRLISSPISRKFLKGASLTIAGTMIWRLLSGVSGILIARILGPYMYGQFALIVNTAATIGPLATLNLGLSATKFVAEFRKTDPARAARLLWLTLFTAGTLAIVSALAIGLAAPYVAGPVFNLHDMPTLIVLGGILVVPVVVSGVQQAAIAGFENFRAIAVANAWRGALQVGIAVPLAAYAGVDGAIVGTIIAGGITMAMLSRVLRSEYQRLVLPEGTAPQGPFSEVGTLWGFALPGIVSGVLYSCVLWIARLFLTNIQDGVAQLGLFEAANQLRLPMLFLSVILSQVVMPMLAEAHGRGSREDFKSALSIQVRVTVIGALAPALLAIAFTDPLVGLFGAEFSAAALIAPLSICTGLVAALNQAMTRVFDASGRRWRSLVATGLFAVVVLVGSYWLVPRLGAMGLAWSFLVGELVRLLVLWIYLDIFWMPRLLRDQLPAVLTALLLLMAGVLVHSLATTLVSGVAGIVFAIVSVWPVWFRLWQRGVFGNARTRCKLSAERPRRVDSFE